MFSSRNSGSRKWNLSLRTGCNARLRPCGLIPMLISETSMTRGSRSIVDAAREQGVEHILNVGISFCPAMQSSGKAVFMRASCRGRYFSIRNNGRIRPWPSALAELAADLAVAAIGETGMDATDSNYPPLSIPARLFRIASYPGGSRSPSAGCRPFRGWPTGGY